VRASPSFAVAGPSSPINGTKRTSAISSLRYSFSKTCVTRTGSWDALIRADRDRQPAPIFNCALRDSGTCGPPAAATMASYGVCSSRVPSPCRTSNPSARKNRTTRHSVGAQCDGADPLDHGQSSPRAVGVATLRAPNLSLAGVRLVIADHALGLPVLRTLSLCTCCRQYPGVAAGRTLRSSHPAISAFPDMAVGSACTSSFSRLARRSLA
jgi:hypothetical protein